MREIDTHPHHKCDWLCAEKHQHMEINELIESPADTLQLLGAINYQIFIAT